MGLKRWFQRVKSMFTKPVKLPGWAALLLVIIQIVPDWKSRIDFWLDVAERTGGYVAVAAGIFLSPYFTPGLLLGGLLWIVFAGEAPRGVQRHHWLRYVGWSVFLICFTALVLTAGYGAIEIRIEQEVSKRDADLQKQAAIRPVYWHPTDFEKSSLAFALDQVPADQRFEIKILCLPDAGSRTFVEDLAKVFLDHQWKVTSNCLFNKLRPSLTGLAVAASPSLIAKKDAEMPKELQTLIKILVASQIPTQFGQYDDGSGADDFYLVVGNAP